MKAKRFLSLALTLSLAVSLAAPALAQEAAPPLPGPTAEEALETMVQLGILDPTGLLTYYDEFDLRFAQQYKEEHPEEYAAFDPDAWFAQEWGEYCSKEEYMADYGLSSEELFREDMWVEHVTCTEEYYAAYEAYLAQEQARKAEEYRAAHPGELEGLDYQWLLERRGYREPMEAYMEDMGFQSQEEARNSLLEFYINSRLEAQERHLLVENYRAADPESWESFDAEAYLAQEWSWYDKDRFMRSRGLLTEEDLREYLYIEMVNDLGLPDWSRGNGEVSLVVNGWERYDSGITAEGGVSYLPVQELNDILGTTLTGEEPVAIRTAAQAAGWDVVWNESSNQVVLLDRERLTRGIVLPERMDVDGEQTDYIEYDLSGFEGLIRRLFSLAEVKEGQSYRTTGTCELTLTSFNTLDGDESRRVELTTDVLVRDDVVDVTLTLNAAQVLELLSRPTLDALARELPKFAFQDLKTLLTGCKAELIWDPGAGRAYWNIPLLSLLEDGAGEVWYSVELDTGTGLTAGELLKVIRSQDWSVGELAYEYLLAQSGESYLGADEVYRDWTQLYGTLNGLFGADTITEKDGAIAWSLTGERMNQMVGNVIGGYLWGYYEGEDRPELRPFKEYDLSLTIDQAGRVETSAAIRLDMDALADMATDSEWMGVGGTALVTWLLNLLDFRYTSTAAATAGHGEGTAQFHWKNQFKLEVETASDRREVKDAPRTAPPEGAEIVEL